MKSLVDTYVQAIYCEKLSSPDPYAMMVHESVILFKFLTGSLLTPFPW